MKQCAFEDGFCPVFAHPFSGCFGWRALVNGDHGHWKVVPLAGASTPGRYADRKGSQGEVNLGLDWITKAAKTAGVSEQHISGEQNLGLLGRGLLLGHPLPFRSLLEDQGRNKEFQLPITDIVVFKSVMGDLASLKLSLWPPRLDLVGLVRVLRPDWCLWMASFIGFDLGWPAVEWWRVLWHGKGAW